MNGDAWSSHKWSSANGRRIEIETGKPVIHHRCSRCQRDFAEDQPSGERYAVYVSVFSLRKLPDHISKQWLDELCPGQPLPLDFAVRTKLIEHVDRHYIRRELLRAMKEWPGKEIL